MLNKDFYALLDAELQKIQQKYAEDPFLKKHHKAPTNQRAYAFLIWFLEFYARKYVEISIHYLCQDYQKKD